MRRRMQYRRVVAVVLFVVLTLSILAPLARAIDVPTNGTWLRTDESIYTVQSWGTIQAAKLTDLTTAISQFESDQSSGKPAFDLILSYGKALAAADWFTNNYYTSDGTVMTLIHNAEGLTVDDILRHMNKLKDFASTISELNGMESSSAFTTAKGIETVTVENLLGYDGFRTALYALLNDYIESGINDVVADVTWDDSWNIMDGQTEVKSEMVSALSSKRSELEPYKELYLQIFDKRYGQYLKQAVKCESQPANGTSVEIVGYTRSGDYKSYAEDEFNIKCSTICTWLSMVETNSETNTNTTSEGINEIDASKGVLAALANAELINGEVVTTDGGDPMLTELGYYALAAGVVYDPFVSIAGNDVYLSVIKTFMEKTDKEEDMIRLLQIAVNTRKPLYMTEGTIESWVDSDGSEPIDVANYSMARLQDVLDIDVRSVRAYVVMTGTMTPSVVDSSTWNYVKGGKGTSSYTENEATTGSTEDKGATNEVYESGDQGYNTTGSGTLMASASQVSAPLMFTCGNAWAWTKRESAARGRLPAEIGGMTSAIIHNAARDCRDNKYIQQASTEMLFLNGLGDIVLSDGTIVLPAIANPVLYTYNTADGADFKESISNDEVTENGGSSYLSYDYGYYPYSATVLNHYPAASYKGEEVVVKNKNDEGKYIMSYSMGAYGGFEWTEIKTSGENQVDVADMVTSPSVWIAGGTFSVRAEPTDTVDLMPLIKMPQSMWRRLGSGFYSLVTAETSFSTRYLQVFSGGRNSDLINYFPLVAPESDVLDSYHGVARPLTTSAVRYLSTRDTMNNIASSGKFRVEDYIVYFVGEGMLGTQYSEQLVKNNQLSYESLVENQYGRFTNMIKNLVSEVIDTVGHIEGVLSIKDGYGNGFFNTVVGFVQEFYIIIAVILIIIVATKFIKGHFSFFYVVAIGCMTFAAFNVYAVWMPTAVPALYNFFVNDIVEEVTWNTVATTAEKYEDTYKNTNGKDAASGKDRPYTATITLYKLTQAEMEDVAVRAGVDISTLRKGEILYLDRAAGIYIQGDQIKMSVDSLLSNNTMRGLYKSQWESIGENDDGLDPVMVDTSENPYIIKLTSPYVSLEAYYTPFCHFERAFLVNLNNFASIFRVERNYYQYPGGLYKDAFLFNAYTDSGVFTAPGDDEVLKLSILPSQIMGSGLADEDDIINLCHQCMDPMEDWLNLRSVFMQPNEAMQHSLWGQMLMNDKYYNPDWTMSEDQQERMSDLIAYINDQTKQFIIRNQDQLNFLSDENAIKIVTLYATTCFTHRVSLFGYWLYPNYVNSCDIELVDVLYGAMTTYRDRNAALDGDIINTVVLNLGVVGALLILVITVIATVFVLILTYLVPVLYVMFGVIMVYKLVNNEQGTGLVKGYAKVTIVSAALYALFSCSLRLVKFGGYEWYGYLLCAIVAFLCLYFLFFVVFSVVTNPMELGNDVLMSNMFNALDRLTRGKLGQLTSNNLTIKSRNSIGYGVGGTRGFMRGDSVDSRYNGIISRRGRNYGYGRYDNFDEGTWRDRIVGRIGSQLDSTAARTGIGYRTSRSFRGLNRGNEWGNSYDNFRHKRQRTTQVND